MTFQDLREIAFADISELTDRNVVRTAANRVLRQINEKFDGLLTTEIVLTKKTDTASLSVQAYASSNYLETATQQNWTTLGFVVGQIIFLTSFTTNTGTYTISSITSVTDTDERMFLTETISNEGATSTVVEHWTITSGYTLDFAARTILLPDKIKKVVEIYHNDLEVNPADHPKVYNTKSDALDLYVWIDDNRIRFAKDILGTAADVLKIQGLFRISELAAFDTLEDSTSIGIPTSMDEVMYAGTKSFILALPKYFNENQVAIETTVFQEALQALILAEEDKREAPSRDRFYNYGGINTYPDN